MSQQDLQSELDPRQRVQVTRPVMGICNMQVCAVLDATDEEILEVCNRENPAGTQNGWGIVVRKPDGSLFQPQEIAPVRCDQDPNRQHLIVLC